MSSVAPSPAVSSPIEINPTEEKRLRARARRRASVCPGAGWALLGYGNRGSLVLISATVCWAAIIWLVATLSPPSVWAAAITTLFVFAVWAVELVDIGWCVVRPLGEGVLIRRFGFTTFTVWVGALIVPLLVATRFGSIEIVDDKMAPTISPGERLIYHRYVAERDLKEGTVVLYRLSPQTKVGLPGDLAIARILAAPEDQLAVQGGHYAVNRELSRYRAQPAPPNAPLTVPPNPKTLTVPEARYFVVQDSASTGIDGQQLGWVRRVDIVSTRLFHFGDGSILRPVE